MSGGGHTCPFVKSQTPQKENTLTSGERRGWTPDTGKNDTLGRKTSRALDSTRVSS